MALKFRWETKFKVTEFGDIPKDWDIEKLCWSVKYLESGNRPRGGILVHVPDGVLSIGGENINWQGELSLNNCLRFSADHYSGLKKGKIEKDDILLVKDGATIGKLAFIDNVPEEKASVNEHVFLLKIDKTKYDAQYLFYYLFSEAGQLQIESAIGGSAQGGINRNIVDVVNIFKFDVLEQTRISNILSWFDSLIENKKRQCEIIENIAEAIFKSMLINYQPFINGRSQQEIVGDMPKEWASKPIGSIADMKKGFPYYGDEKKEQQIEGSKLFITLNNVRGCSKVT
jgi:type I restriction enzyme S subunit